MSGFVRPAVAGKRTQSSMRPPARPANFRSQTNTPSITGRASPAESVTSTTTAGSRIRSPHARTGGMKRKERDFERDAVDETNINVVVRCRGRNDREVRENSGVVVRTDGTKGRNVELSMGPSALSNKTYHFDKVFAPAADQGMVFDEVVTPTLDEVLAGFNCTIFAYGQTGTGKTYTMSGDITDTSPPPDGAGIIPRVLHALFYKLDGDETAENSVKCSFIELYNEELRDLLSPDDHVKLKIYEDGGKKGQVGTLVQGMEESHIRSASKGIQLLREGSHKRQVAATKCNDLSSRSHTVFTITVYMKRTSDAGEDFISAGKLNLVDLAGSENIQRSGAENKRAAEAGLINKSLLTLGRVINALVEKSSHIPYRESKLTRLLQDSLGGQTKTCIIATLSPAKSNLEETISTLDYAFRAKNIRNKPQVNQTVSKRTLLREFTAEIEKLKSELIATRHRNGVYLTAENYEEITTESESRRILSEEQRDRIETMEANLRSKIQDLFTLNSRFNSLRKDNDATKTILDGTRGILEKTEAVLEHTRQSLSDETALRKAHENTEERLATTGLDLISTLERTTSDIGGLHSKLRRRSDLQSLNRKNWTSTQARVAESTLSAERHMDDLMAHQGNMIAGLSERMDRFVADEVQKLQASQSFLEQKATAFAESEKEVNEQTVQAKEDLNEVLEEIKALREDVKDKVGAGLNDLSTAAQRISAGIITELDAFHTQLHGSYATLGRDFKSTFDDLVRELQEQQTEIERLRSAKHEADLATEQALRTARERMVAEYEAEKRLAAGEREGLLAQVLDLVTKQAQTHESRVTDRIATLSSDLGESHSEFLAATNAYDAGMDACRTESATIAEGVCKSRETVKAKIQADFAVANEHTSSLRRTTTSVHENTVRIVADQLSHMDTQLHSLDDIVARVRSRNDDHHSAHASSLATLGSTAHSSYSSIGDHLTSSFARIQELGSDVGATVSSIASNLPQLDADGEIRTLLHELRCAIDRQSLEEYAPTGHTPQRIQYEFTRTLPRTEAHQSLLAKLRGKAEPPAELEADAIPLSPSKGMVFTDVHHLDDDDLPLASRTRPEAASGPQPGTLSLRELDVNALGHAGDATGHAAAEPVGMPPLKRHNTDTAALDRGVSAESRLPTKKAGARKTVGGLNLVADGRENLPPSKQPLSASVGPGGPSGRRLRSQGSD